MCSSLRLTLLLALAVGCSEAAPPATHIDPVLAMGPPDQGPPPPIVFVDVAAEAGLDEPHSEAEDRCAVAYRRELCWIPHFVGGVAVADVDRDGRLDVYLTHLDRPGTLWRNLGDGRFADVTAAVGLDQMETASNGAAFVDVDRDGDLDLYVTALAHPEQRRTHYLFILDGGGFTEDSDQRNSGIESDLYRGGSSIAVGDYDHDGWPDLHVAEYKSENLRIDPHTRLLHNLGVDAPGVFEDVTRAAGVWVHRPGCATGDEACHIVTHSNAFVDVDEDGWQDLLLVRDYGNSRLFWNQHDGTFLEGGITAGVATEWDGMGSTVGDYDGDGHLDWFVTAIGNTGEMCGDELCNTGTPEGAGNRMYRYVGDRRFEDSTDDAAVRHGGWGWGTAFLDHDNDGDLDLFVANGMRSEFDPAHPYLEDPLRFFENDGRGHYTEVSEALGLTDRSVGTGVAVFDYDDDGDLDILMVRNHGVPALFRNEHGNRNGWLRVTLDASESAPGGIGARLFVQVEPDGPTQVREVGSVTHYIGQSPLIAHFGVGQARRIARVEVRWPTGRRQILTDVGARQLLVLHERDAR